MTIITFGIDLAKNIFAVHGVNENGHAKLVKPKVSRDADAVRQHTVSCGVRAPRGSTRRYIKKK